MMLEEMQNQSVKCAYLSLMLCDVVVLMRYIWVSSPGFECVFDFAAERFTTFVLNQNVQTQPRDLTYSQPREVCSGASPKPAAYPRCDNQKLAITSLADERT